MSTKTYFHFPSDPELHAKVKAAAAREKLSMAMWLDRTVRDALDDEIDEIDLLLALEEKVDLLLSIVGGTRE